MPDQQPMIQVGASSNDANQGTPPTAPPVNAPATPPQDEYSDPIPQDATVGNGTSGVSPNAVGGTGDDEYGTPIPEGAQVGKKADDPSLDIKPEDSTVSKIAKGTNAVGAGIGDALLNSINNGADLLGIPHATLEARQKELEQENSGNPTLNNIGYGGESLMEFLMGDEALKGLSLADKLSKSAKIAKILETSPKLTSLLKLGANAGKAATALNPEDLAAINKSPILARLAGAGMDAIRQGGVQAAQTAALKTGGSVGDRAKAGAVEGAEMAGGSAVLGGTLGAISGAAAKAGKAAETVAKLNEVAANAPTETDVNKGIEQRVSDALKPEQDVAQKAKTTGTSDVAGFAAGAPEKTTLTETARQMAADAEQQYHDEYNAGVNGIKGDLAGETVPYKGSPFLQSAQKLAQEGATNSKPLDEAFNQTRPGSPRANRMLDALTGAAKEGDVVGPEQWVDANGIDQIEPPETVTKAPVNLDIDELISRRKQLGERLRNTGYQTADDRADRKVYKTLMQGIDDTIDQLAKKSAEHPEDAGMANAGPKPPSILDRYRAINGKYRTAMRLLENKDVQSILQGQNGEVAAKLMRGDTTLHDINAVKQVLGEDNFASFATDSLQRFVADSVSPEGTVDYASLLKKWNNIKEPVREAMFGRFPAETFSNVLNGISGADEKLNSVNDTIANLMGNGDVKSLLKDPTRLSEMASTIGPDATKELGKSVLENQIREASTVMDKKGKTSFQFDPNKMLAWVNSLKDSPEVVDTLFKVDPEMANHYDRLVSDVSHAASVKKLVKYGLPLTAAGAGAHALPVIAVLTFLAGAGTHGLENAGKVLDTMANHPAVWKAVSGIDKAANSGALKTVATIPAKVATDIHNSKRNVYGATQYALGGK